MTYLQAVIVEIAWAAVRHEGYLRSLYDRHVTRNGGYRSAPAKGKAIVTVAHAILVIIWHILSSPDAVYNDLGADYYDRRADISRRARSHAAAIERLGYKVTIEPVSPEGDDDSTHFAAKAG